MADDQKIEQPNDGADNATPGRRRASDGRPGLFAELKRRNVIRMAGLYLVGAWLLVQVAATLLPVFDAPAWMMKALVITIALLFVPALVLAWIYELTPEGLKRDAEVTPEESIAPQTARRMEHLIVATLLLALVYFGVDKFVLAPREAAAAAAMQKKAAMVASLAPASAARGKSIAVLPFTDLSPNKDQAYFSDGMAEEILNALAQVKDLKVAGRTSSFQFKGRNEDLRTIGKTLGVASILEGSVRKQGDKVRITAQLIRSQDGFHLWSESFDGDLKDVFALQERIARAITDKLQVVLSEQQTTRLVNVGTENTQAYALYLQATAVFNRRDGEHIPDAIADLHEAIRLDPKYARGHARLALLYVIANNYAGLDEAQSLAAAEREARTAIDLAPMLAEPHAALSAVHSYRRQWVATRAALEHALTLDPGDATANFWLGLAQLNTGYHRQGIASVERTLAIEPLLPNALAWRAFFYLDAGDRETARRMAQRAAEGGLRYGDTVLAMVAHAEGRNTDAVVHLQRGLPGLLAAFPDGASAILAQGLYGDAVQRAKAIAMMDTYLASKPKSIATVVPWTFLMLGEPARALAVAQDPKTVNDTFFLSTLWSSHGAAARSLPQFPQFARKMGMTEVWDKYGPPDTCRRVAPGNYVCA